MQCPTLTVKFTPLYSVQTTAAVVVFRIINALTASQEMLVYPAIGL